MTPRETYPPGVTCFIDTEREDVDAAAAFYGGLFGWSFDDVTPPGQPRFVMAKVDGLTVAGIGAPFEGTSGPVWNTYVSVADADAMVGKVEAAGGTVVAAPFDVGPAGRMAVFADPEGAHFRVWQAGRDGRRRSSSTPRARGTGATSRPATSKRRRRSTARSSTGSSTRSTSARARAR